MFGAQVGNSGQSPLPKLPNLAAVQEASHLAELAESELALTWTGAAPELSQSPASKKAQMLSRGHQAISTDTAAECDDGRVLDWQGVITTGPFPISVFCALPKIAKM